VDFQEDALLCALAALGMDLGKDALLRESSQSETAPRRNQHDGFSFQSVRVCLDLLVRHAEPHHVTCARLILHET